MDIMRSKTSKKELSFEDLGFAKIDHHRKTRKGFPEVIFCQGKTKEQIAKIAEAISKKGDDVLATRATKEDFLELKKFLPGAKYDEVAKIITCKKRPNRVKSKKKILIVTAGTSDIPVAREAEATLAFLGNNVEFLYDVGVAGIHRIIKNIKKLQKASVIIAIAGMEGALPSVIGGLVSTPIIAVPTSVGYGANFKGLSALLTMLNSCASGIAVVNIDNGFGAAVFADSIINKLK